MRRALGVLAMAAVLSGCPGSLDRPERFVMDAGVDGGCPDVEQALLIPSCGGVSCHENPGAANNLDLVAAGVAARIKASTSTCQGKPMVSFLLDKVKATPACGAQMPLGSDPLTPFEVQCLESYLAKLGDGGI